jgi:hypothetical protein
MHTMETLNQLTNAELVGIYNGLADRPLKNWKGPKKALVYRILPLLPRGPDVVEMPAAEEGAGGVPAARCALESAETATEQVGLAESEPAKDAVAETIGKPVERTIRAAALALLCMVAYYEDRNAKSGPENVVPPDHRGARSVGLPYLDIVERIRGEFPGCETTVACLRWYSVKVRVEELGYEGLRLPQRRPRARPATRNEA